MTTSHRFRNLKTKIALGELEEESTFSGHAGLDLMVPGAGGELPVGLYIDELGSLQGYKLGPVGEDLAAPLAVIGGALKIVKGKGRARLARLTLREVESFFRDQNDIPAWKAETAPLGEEDFNRFKALFVDQVGRFLLRKCASHPAPSLTWRMIQRIDYFSSFLGEIDRALFASDGGKLELIDVTDDTVLVSLSGECGTCGQRETNCFPLLEEIMAPHLDLFGIKLVAEGDSAR